MIFRQLLKTNNLANVTHKLVVHNRKRSTHTGPEAANLEEGVEVEEAF